MSSVNVEKGVSEVFTDILDAKLPEEREILIFSEYAGWDSVAHMTLIAGLEDKFDCMLDMDDIIDMSSFDKSVEILKKYV